MYRMIGFRRYRNTVLSFMFFLTIALFLSLIKILQSQLFSNAVIDLYINNPSHWHTTVIEKSTVSPTRKDCHFYNCFNVYKCGRSGKHKLLIYIYPLIHYVDDERVEVKFFSNEFLRIIETIKNSEYYISDPEKACLFVPSVDTLNENNLRKKEIALILASLSHWNEGENHLLFNFLPGTAPDYYQTLNIERGKALIAGGGFSSLTYRRSFDISIPVYNPLFQDTYIVQKPINERKYLLVVSQLNIHREYLEDLQMQIADGLALPSDIFVLQKCPETFANLSVRCHEGKMINYPEVLNEGKFCLITRGGRLGQTVLYDAMQNGCIPVVVIDYYVLPFSEVVDWRKAAVQIYEDDLPYVVEILKKEVSVQRIKEMQKQVAWLFKNYFATIEKITLTTLRILNDRIFPFQSLSLEQWNLRESSEAVSNPLFLPVTAPKEDGFTAVVLTYDRIESLFQVIKMIVQVPSLRKIIIVWNNQNKGPPQVSLWPKIEIPIKVIQTKQNKLSNRFYPYEEIETECILAIDDDIVMMTADELEFGYQVWREFPDRIVGFPSRNVVLSQDHKWKYDSEWTNEVSMVLTGVAFYHKYWSYAYTTQLPSSIKEWVDEHMNCEDIAMNFLVSNKTGKAPIKVTPRKKFKCGECSSGDLSANEAHLIERSQCVSHFTKIFGVMPLKTVEFRADPVLYMDNFPEKLKLYSDMGSL